MLQNVTVTLLINLIFMFFTGKFVSSCIYKKVGDHVVIAFDGEKLEADNDILWTHNQKRVYLKRRSQVKISELNVDEYGSLILKNVQKNTSGEYIGEAFNKNGILKKKTVKQFCVQEPVSKPTVMVECVEKGVNLTCSPVNNGVVVSWTKNGMKINATHAFLHVISPELKSGDNFSCTVSNQISTKSAKEVKPVCSDTGLRATHANDHKGKEVDSNRGYENTNDMSEKKHLFGLDWMLVILTGVGSFLLILSIICCVCVCRCCRRNKRTPKGEEQHQLVYLKPY